MKKTRIKRARMPFISKKPLLIMKLTFLLLMIGFLQVSAGLYSQSAKLTIEMRNVKVMDVLDEIERQSEFRFAYSSKYIDMERMITVRLREKSIEETLQSLFSETGVGYVIDDRHILLFPKALGAQQPQPVTGTVTDNNGDPLIGVTVMVKGTTLGTITDVQGNFSLANVPEDGVLVFSFVGMSTQEIEVGIQTNIDVRMEVDAIGLEEVIAIGYGTQKKINLTGAVEVVNGEQLEHRATTTLSQSLQGNAPGVSFTPGQFGFEPGAELNIQIRGQGSPLVLIDGVPGSINLLNPNVIESISILKDAASAAIYGAQATYGVVLITTKSGAKDDKMHVEFSTNASYMHLIRLPHMADSYTTALAYNEASVNTGTSPMYTNETIDRILAYQADPTLPETVPSKSNPQTWANNFESNANYDWFDVWYGNGSRNQENLTLSGGNEKISYYFNAGHVNDEGVLNYGTDNFRRYNTMARIDLNAKKWLKFSSITRYFNRTRRTPSSQVGGKSSSNTGYLGLFWWIARDYPSQYKISPNGVYSRISWIPLNAFGGVDTDKENAFNQKWATSINPLKGWTIDADYSINIMHTGFNSNNFTVYEDKVDGSLVPIGGTYPNWVANSQRLYFYNTLNVYSTYNFDVKEKHYISVLAGYQMEESNNKYLYSSRRNLISQDLPSLDLATGVVDTKGNTKLYATQGIFMRFNYNFDEKYLLEFNGRYDGTYKFASGKKWGFFPSASAAWIISNENFWEEARSSVNLLKLRGSIGELGNQRVAAYQDLALMDVNTNLSWIINGERPSYVTAPNLINPDLTWETCLISNFGIDLATFKNRLSFSGDIYKRRTYDQLGPSDALPSVIGVNNLPNSNNMETVTKGWELSSGWKDRIGNDFIYSVTGFMFDNVTKITKYNNPTGILTKPYAGMELGEIWGYVTKGLINTQERADEINANNIQQAISGRQYNTGDIEYTDLDGDGLITRGDNTVYNPGDRKVIGNRTPRYQWGLKLQAQWKGFDLSTVWNGTLKREEMLTGNMQWGFQQTWWSTLLPVHLDYYRDAEADEYKGLGINLDAFYPRPYNNKSMNNKNQQTQTRYLQKSRYARLKNVTLGYTVPTSWLDKLRLEGLYVYLTGENLWTITPLMDHFDPETANIGLESGYSMPAQAVYTIGLNVKF